MTLCVAAAHAATINATQNGPINDSATWGGTTTPTEAGNTDTWDTNGFNLTGLVNSEHFHGDLLQVTGGSRLIPASGSTGGLRLQATTFDNGGISRNDNLLATFFFNQQELTFAGGGAFFSSNNNARDIRFEDGVWVGSGPISYTRDGSAGNSNSTFTIFSNNDVSGYTGTISVRNTSSFATARARLVIQAETDGSFAVDVGTGGLLHLSVQPDSLIFSSLVLGVDTIAPGNYVYTDFTIAQQAFFSAGANPKSIQVIPEPAAIGLIFFCGLAAILIRRRLKA